MILANIPGYLAQDISRIFWKVDGCSVFQELTTRGVSKLFDWECKMARASSSFGDFGINAYNLELRLWSLSEQRGTYTLYLPRNGNRAYLESGEPPP